MLMLWEMVDFKKLKTRNVCGPAFAVAVECVVPWRRHYPVVPAHVLEVHVHLVPRARQLALVLATVLRLVATAALKQQPN